MQSLERYQEALRDAEAELAKWQKLLNALEAVKPIDRSLYHGLYRSEIIERVACAAKDVVFINERMAHHFPTKPKASYFESERLSSIIKPFVFKRLGYIKLRRKRLSRLANMCLFILNTCIRRYNRALKKHANNQTSLAPLFPTNLIEKNSATVRAAAL